MRRRRTIYHNDARHYYLWVFDSPIKLEDAWHPIDEVADTAVDTFSYCVERGDGIFYPSKVGLRFGTDRRPFKSAITWHAWESMQSLIDRGLDPLRVLVDRAHEKGLDFFADLRLATYGGMNPAHKRADGGRGFGHPEVRDHQFGVLKELVTDYPIEGVELDYPAAFGESPFYFRPEDVVAYTPVMTEWVDRVSRMVRGRPGTPGEIGARVFPTEEMNIAQGLDVRTWLKEGLVDFVVPLLYAYNNLDPDMPIDWLIEAAHEVDIPVYGMLQHSVRDETTVPDDRRVLRRIYPTPEIMRAAVANFWDRGVDGLYTWFMSWPLGSEQRSILTELGDVDLVKGGNKRYVLRRRSKEAAALGYDAPLPIEIASANPDKRYQIPFYIADDIQGVADRIRQVHLRINISNVVTQDRFTILLNGKSLADETCLRDFGRRDSARDQWLEFHLEDVRPAKGQNLLEISLDARPAGLEGGVRMEEVEIYVEYGPHPSGLNALPRL
jgi:hypothetical protein